MQVEQEMVSNETCLSINMLLLSDYKNFTKLPECIFSIITSKGKHVCVKTDTGPKRMFFNRLLSKAFLLKNKESFLPNDQLTLQCKLAIYETVNLSEKQTHWKMPKSTLVDDLSGLLQSGQSADVVLRCEEEEFKAHKLILATRSPVFAAMFDNDMKEKEKSCVEIVDMDKDVLREVLQYIYTDESSNLDNMTGGLLAAADKVSLTYLYVPSWSKV